MMKTLPLLALVATGACAPRPPPPPPPTFVQVDLASQEVYADPPPTNPGQTASGATPDTAPHTAIRDQPPSVKLKLGHYRNEARGIGVVVDLASGATEDVADIDPAKLRFDGDAAVYHLEGHHGQFGRIDYVSDHGRVMLEVWDTGRVNVYIPDPATDRSSDAIAVYRDADADPL